MTDRTREAFDEMYKSALALMDRKRADDLLPSRSERYNLRLRAGFTKSDAAKLCGITAPNFSFWERGVQKPRKYNLDRYVLFLQVCRRIIGERGEEE